MVIWNERHSMGRDFAIVMMLYAWQMCFDCNVDTDDEEKSDMCHMMNMGGEL